MSSLQFLPSPRKCCAVVKCKLLDTYSMTSHMRNPNTLKVSAHKGGPAIVSNMRTRGIYIHSRSCGELLQQTPVWEWGHLYTDEQRSWQAADLHTPTH